MDMLNEFNDSYNEFLIRKAEAAKSPIMGTIELTPVCNMKCSMCYIQQEQSSVSCRNSLKGIDFWENVIDQAVDKGLLFCLLTGGEIFTYPGFRELYERLKQKPIHIVLNTNGTLIDEDTVKWLAANPPRRLNISLYGASADTYERLCHHRAGFDRVIRGFELLKEYDIQFRVHGVLVPSNIGDYEGIKAICNRFRVPLEMSYYMFPNLRKEAGTVSAPERFTPEKMAEVAFMYRRDQCGGETEAWSSYVNEKCRLFDHPEENPVYGYDRIACESGCCAFWINWKGLVAGCSMSDENNYDLEQMSFSEAWRQIKDYTGEARLSEKCAVCGYRPVCPVCAAAACCETGEINGTPDYLCRFAEEFAGRLREERDRIHGKSE